MNAGKDGFGDSWGKKTSDKQTFVWGGGYPVVTAVMAVTRESTSKLSLENRSGEKLLKKVRDLDGECKLSEWRVFVETGRLKGSF